jgi:hypothetical protein
MAIWQYRFSITPLVAVDFFLDCFLKLALDKPSLPLLRYTRAAAEINKFISWGLSLSLEPAAPK